MSDRNRKSNSGYQLGIWSSALVLGFISLIPAWFYSSSINSFLLYFIAFFIAGVAVIVGIANISWLQPIDEPAGRRKGIVPESNDKYVIGFAVFNILLVVLGAIIIFTNVLGTSSVALWEGKNPHLLVFVLAIPLIPALLILGYNVYIRIDNPN
jgi:hypothetical protein